MFSLLCGGKISDASERHMMQIDPEINGEPLVFFDGNMLFIRRQGARVPQAWLRVAYYRFSERRSFPPLRSGLAALSEWPVVAMSHRIKGLVFCSLLTVTLLHWQCGGLGDPNIKKWEKEGRCFNKVRLHLLVLLPSDEKWCGEALDQSLGFHTVGEEMQRKKLVILQVIAVQEKVVAFLVRVAQ